MHSRHRGFTLTELLVVVAIVAILAGLLLPVFNTARAAARKARCIGNMRSIAAAVTMYVTDWDGFWPAETSRRVTEYFNTAPGGGQRRRWPETCERSYQGNPYLRAPVVLDEYVRDREVWRCPETHLLNGAGVIIAPPANGDWLEVWVKHQGEWGEDRLLGPCYTAWPSGWGGPVTDSFAQGVMAIRGPRDAAGDSKAFLQSIGVNEHLRWQSLAAVDDPSQHVICGDAGTRVDLWSAAQLAFPDTCGLGSPNGPSNRFACSGADWENCSWTRQCGLSQKKLKEFYDEPSARRPAARHNGGSNVGFLDGHVKWQTAESILSSSPPFPDATLEGGLCACWPGNGVLGPHAQPYGRDTPVPMNGVR